MVSPSRQNIPPHFPQRPPGQVVSPARQNVPPHPFQGPRFQAINLPNQPFEPAQQPYIPNGIAPPSVLREAPRDQQFLDHQSQGFAAHASDHRIRAPSNRPQSLMFKAGFADFYNGGVEGSYEPPYSPGRIPSARCLVQHMNPIASVASQGHTPDQHSSLARSLVQHMNSLASVTPPGHTPNQRPSFTRYPVQHMNSIATMVPPGNTPNTLSIGREAGGPKRKIDDTDIEGLEQWGKFAGHHSNQAHQASRDGPNM
jgi:hypothetical protein